MLSFPPMRPPWEDLEPASRSAVERQRHAAKRVDQFATAVFAVAMALPVIRLIEQASTTILPGSPLIQMVRAIGPAIASCAIALLALLASWLLHHLVSHYLTRSSGTLLLLHAVLLPSVLFIPFSASLLNLLSLTRPMLLLFEGNVLLVQLLLMLTWRHAIRGGLLFGSDVPRRVVLRVRLLLGAGVGALVAVAGVAMVSPAVSLVAFAVVLLAQMIIIARGGYALDLHTPPPCSPSGY